MDPAACVYTVPRYHKLHMCYASAMSLRGVPIVFYRSRRFRVPNRSLINSLSGNCERINCIEANDETRDVVAKVLPALMIRQAPNCGRALAFYHNGPDGNPNVYD
jgi:hypothetical protein